MENQSSNNSSVMPKNYLTESILVTVFCCLPLGIVAIINASKVEKEYHSGNYEAAQKASDEAKKFMKWGLIGSAIAYALMIFGSLILGGIGAISSM